MDWLKIEMVSESHRMLKVLLSVSLVVFLTCGSAFPNGLRTTETEYNSGSIDIRGETPGVSRPSDKPNTISQRKDSKPHDRLQLYLFYELNCGYCQKLKRTILPNLEKKKRLNFEIVSFPISDIENYKKFSTLEDKLGEETNELPALFIAERIFGGKKEIEEDLEKYLDLLLNTRSISEINLLSSNSIQQAKDNLEGAKVQTRLEKLRILPVLGAGIVDGINPCAMAVITFLLSYLYLLKKNRKQIIVAGIFFILSVFITYFLVGLGLLEGIQHISAYGSISLILRYLIGALAFVLGVLSLYDYILCKRGHPSKMLLQLPRTFKDKIHSDIRNKMANRNIVMGAFGLGFGVSVFELVCTGQMYLPTIIYMIKSSEARPKALCYLSFYNLMFIFPLIVIFMLVYFGLSWQRLYEFLSRKIPILKLSLAIVFFLLAYLLIFE